MADRQLTIPPIGFGTWNRDGDIAYRGVSDALEVGYRHIDTAEGYNNEDYVGKALAESRLPRNEIFLTTKVAPESFGPGQIRPHVEASLEKLQVERVDLLLLHYPSINDEYDIEDYMAQFAEVYDAGLTASIGVSNFTKHYIDLALTLLGDRKIQTNQVEIHIYLQNRSIVDYCSAREIVMTAYSPLARGELLHDPLLLEIANEHNASTAQISLAFLLAEGYIVIPSAGSKQRIVENFGSSKITLSDAEITRIRLLDRRHRLVDGPWCPTWDE